MKTDVWLARPRTIRFLWRCFLAILALTVLAQAIWPVHGKFGIDGTFGFGAWFGFVSCIALVLGSKALGAILKRPEDHYES